MTLNDYLAQRKKEDGLTEPAFAEQIGVDQSTVNRLRKGGIPSKPTMERIFEVTKGQVRADDFFGIAA